MRYSLLHLLGWMAFVALGLGALAGATSFVANAAFTATVLVFSGVSSGAILAKGSQRAFCVGFLLFGGIHLILTLAPWLDARTGPSLLTRDALDTFSVALGHKPLNRGIMPAGVWDGLNAWIAGSPQLRFVNFVLIGQCWFSIAIGWLAGLTVSRVLLRTST